MTNQEHDDSAQSWSISIRGVEIKGLAWGNPQSKPVLALHGWQDNAGSFIPLMKCLSQNDQLRVVAPDLPGHGQSSWRPQQSAYHFVDWLRDIYDLLDALEWTTCSIIGHSMGAGIASLWAGVFPHRCSSLVLIEGLGPLTTPAEHTPDQLAKALQTHVYPFKERASLDQLVKQRIKLTPMKPDNARLLMQRSTQVTQQHNIKLCQDPMLRMPSLLRFTEEQVHVFLKRIECEVLLIIARNGWPFDRQMIKGRVQCLSRYESQYIEGYHHVHMDEAKQVARMCEHFFRRVE